MGKGLGIAVLIFAALAIVISFSVSASSPEAVDEHRKEANSKCSQASNLLQARAEGNLIEFDDSVGYTALIIQGHYPQRYMNNRVGRVLCLFNRTTRKAYVAEITTDLGTRP